MFICVINKLLYGIHNYVGNHSETAKILNSSYKFETTDIDNFVHAYTNLYIHMDGLDGRFCRNMFSFHKGKTELCELSLIGAQ